MNSRSMIDHGMVQERSVIVVGGGLAGLAAAVALSERGYKVTVVEKGERLGGRLASWSTEVAGDEVPMERGFHGFFRQYYNVRNLLRRVDPELRNLTPLVDYPVADIDGRVQTFRGLPQRAPWNMIAMTRRCAEIRARDLLRIDRHFALAPLRFDGERTYEEFDGMSAAHLLDAMRFPHAARRLLFDVFAHSFFNPEEKMSAAEMLMMFHFYFTGNPEGLVFDVLRRPFEEAIFSPLGKYLKRLGAVVRTGQGVHRVGRMPRPGATGYRVMLDGGETLEAERLVFATNVPGLKSIFSASTDLHASEAARRVGGLEVTHPFAVERLWLGRPMRADRPAFLGTAGHPLLDNISLFERFEDRSAAWAARRGGSVVELHAYGVDPAMREAEVSDALISGLYHFYPEAKRARVLGREFLMRRDCPAFGVGSFRDRVRSHEDLPGVTFAGDFVRTEAPSALMERAVMTGFEAANHFLREDRVPRLPIPSIPHAGLAARAMQRTRRKSWSLTSATS